MSKVLYNSTSYLAHV